MAEWPKDHYLGPRYVPPSVPVIPADLGRELRREFIIARSSIGRGRPDEAIAAIDRALARYEREVGE